MKSFLLITTICFVMISAAAQVNEAIPTPNDLQLQGVEILSKKTLPDGTVEIRYKAKNGNTYRRTISPAKKGEVQIVKEWTEGLKETGAFDPHKFQIKATGTGNTTGHIANILVTNNNDFPVDILPQNVFIPSDGKYQSYVGRIPDGITVPPGQTNSIPVTGYCTDIHTPPVPPGTNMPPFENWIPVHDPNDIIDGDDYPIVTTKPVSSFVPDVIPEIVESPGYTASPPAPDADIIITWPGTNIPVGGTLDPDDDPVTFAPVIVKVMDEVEEAATSITETGILTTPFSPDPPRQIESTVQQVVWIYTSVITGDPYGKPDFTERVYDQYEDNAGKAVTTLPEEHKEKMDNGIDEFWDFFTAVGVEAKVLSGPSSTSSSATPVTPVHDITTTTPGAEKEEVKKCSLEEKITDTGPKLDYAIADTGTKDKNEKVKEAFKTAIEKAAGMITGGEGSDTIDIGFTTPQMPASAWSLYFPHTVAGQANASAMVVDMKNPLNSSWTTQPLQTKAEGSREVILTHKLGENCTSTLVGVNFAKIRASSGLKASLGSIEALKVINFVGEIAIDIVIQRGKGTYKKLSKYLAEKTKDMAEEAAKDFIKSEIEKFNEQWEGKTDEEAEQSMDDLLKDIKDPEAPDQLEEAEAFLDDWLAAMVEEGEGFDAKEKIEGDLLDKIDSPIDWAPIKTNTYAIGEGSLDVFVDADHGLALAASGVRYKRVELEAAKDAEKGGGVFCDEGLASHTTSGTIKLKTTGKTESWAAATGEGIFSTGHGIAVSSLESFNGMYVIAICECPGERLLDTYASITGFDATGNMSGIWASLFQNLMDDVADELDRDLATYKNRPMPKDWKAKVQKGLEDAATRAAQSILPCGKE